MDCTAVSLRKRLPETSAITPSCSFVVQPGMSNPITDRPLQPFATANLRPCELVPGPWRTVIADAGSISHVTKAGSKESRRDILAAECLPRFRISRRRKGQPAIHQPITRSADYSFSRQAATRVTFAAQIRLFEVMPGGTPAIRLRRHGSGTRRVSPFPESAGGCAG